MKKIKLIGLHGEPGCGKDTVADILCEIMAFRKISLAEPIRKGITAMFRIPQSHLVDRELKEQPLDELCGKSPRYLMQTLGTEWGRNCVDLDVWLKIAQRDIDYLSKLAQAGNAHIDGIVISDIRFEGEAKWLREQGGIIWHINRPDNPLSIESDHASNKLLEPQHGDQFLTNNCDIDELCDRVAELLNQEEATT